MTDAGTEQALCQWRGTKHATADSTCRLTEDGHLRGIATEVSDITLHPLQGVDLVQQAIVAGMSLGRLLRQFRMGHET